MDSSSTVPRTTLITQDAIQTESIGRSLAQSLKVGDLVALDGELGAGKTCLVKGIAQGLGIESKLVRSPTFVLHHQYSGQMKLHHIDCYRLDKNADLRFLDLEQLLTEGIVLIEWAKYADLSEWNPIQIDIAILSPTSRQVICQGIAISDEFASY